MQDRQAQSATPIRVQRDGPSPAEHAQQALQEELQAHIRRTTTELKSLTDRDRALTGAERERVAELQGQLLHTAMQLRDIEVQRSQLALDKAAQDVAARALGGGIATTGQPAPVEQIPDIPQGAIDISIAFFVSVAAAIILFPLMRSLGRVLEKRSAPPQRPDPEVVAQLRRMEQALDAVSIEVERIAEGQRFTTRLLAEREHVPQPHG